MTVHHVNRDRLRFVVVYQLGVVLMVATNFNQVTAMFGRVIMCPMVVSFMIVMPTRAMIVTRVRIDLPCCIC